MRRRIGVKGQGNIRQDLAESEINAEVEKKGRQDFAEDKAEILGKNY